MYSTFEGIATAVSGRYRKKVSYSITTLEFDSALELVARETQTAAGRRLALELGPSSDRAVIEAAHSAVTESLYLKREKGLDWSFAGMEDTSPAMPLLSVAGSVADPQMLLFIADICGRAVSARLSIAPERAAVPNLWSIAEMVDPDLNRLSENIRRFISPGGEIDDSASPELRRIRNEISNQRARINRLLESRMRAAGDAIQDPIVTVRNDRFVIPVKADFRSKVVGVTHSFSSSGQTAFIEPLEAIDANNELQSLYDKQEREIYQILVRLTDSIRNRLPEITKAADAIARLDVVRAKRLFLERFSAVVPAISDDETLELLDARHPLLEEALGATGEPLAQSEKPQVVPITIVLDREHPAMIISGANAGGKTVALKTAGLLSMLALAGIPVPARTARIPLYKSVLADIGDHQSLAANLSTFTSHMANIARMMQDCRPPALVILDEVGTGTDPEEGSALGVAIVEYFRSLGAQIIASTHYKALKIYAANDPTVINASVEFDQKTLKPTYRLLIGLAGSSSGIEIARRFGIPDNVAERARSLLDRAAHEADKYLAKLREELQIAESIRHALETEREAVAEKYSLLEAEAMQREQQRKAEFERTMANAIDAFERSSKAAIEAIEDRSLKAKLEKERLSRKSALKRGVLRTLESLSPSIPESTEPLLRPSSVEGTAIAIGSDVLTPMGMRGRIEKIDGDMAEILAGRIRLRERLENLRPVAVTESAPTRKTSFTRQFEATNAQSELNLIGKTTTEAEYEVDKFIDEAYLGSLPRVRIIHGFGTGTLRKFVHNLLKQHELVERFFPASPHEGGNGATIVELKSD